MSVIFPGVAFRSTRDSITSFNLGAAVCSSAVAVVVASNSCSGSSGSSGSEFYCSSGGRGCRMWESWPSRVDAGNRAASERATTGETRWLGTIIGWLAGWTAQIMAEYAGGYVSTDCPLYYVFPDMAVHVVFRLSLWSQR